MTDEKREKLNNRYSLIDALRGFAVINMIAYHLCYDLLEVFGLRVGFYTEPWAVVWERFICCSFIIISGISVHFTSHGYRRGIIVSLCGAAVTAITAIFMPSQVIWFGVLTLIGLAMLITYALRRLLDKIGPAAGMAATLVLFALLYGLPSRYIGFFGIRLLELPAWLYGSRVLSVIGLPGGGFFSADYFPLFPWLFLFLFGYFLWSFIERRGWQRAFRPRVPVLDFIGRHSLIIYMLHQPLLYGVCLLIFGRQG